MTYFSDYRFKENIRKYNIEDKDEIILDLQNIDHSFTGRVDANIANTFILEASQMLVNSIAIFEMGYFDAAYYCLRESIEIATLMAYFVDLDETRKEQEYLKWKVPTNRFSMQKEMIRILNENGEVIKDMKFNMNNFFERMNNISNELNKYVHKQGLNNLYVSKNHPLSLGNNPEFKDKKTIEIFKYYLKQCIGIVAIMRLSIDPFPILLIDKEIYNRTNDIIMEPYSQDFINKYLMVDDIEAYKTTNFYKEHYNDIMRMPLKSNCVTDIIKSHYIDLNEREQILSEIELLSFPFNIVALLAIKIKDSVKIYTYGGFYTFFTSNPSNRSKLEFSSRDFMDFKNNDFNKKYDEVFISTVKVKDELFYIEHNNKFCDDDINYVKELVNELNKIYNN